MQVTDKLTKALTEAKYLNADNVSRYRCIMRIFFENYEKLRYWLYQEEVYAQMVQDPFFAEYKLEQCQQDLAMLVEWKNLNTIQDTRKVSSIEEFKNKKFRYQMSEYSVEIERLVLRLENLFIEGASLEPTLLERIRINISRFPQMVDEDLNKVYTWWNDLNNDFVRLNQNYQDYIRDLNSVKAEEMMHTKEFLVFKDRLVEYLRNFIKGLQRNVGVIEEDLRTLEDRNKQQVFEKIVQYAFFTYNGFHAWMWKFHGSCWKKKQRDGFRVFMNGLFLLMEKKMRLVNFLMQPMKLSGESQGMRHSSVRKMRLEPIEEKNTVK